MKDLPISGAVCSFVTEQDAEGRI